MSQEFLTPLDRIFKRLSATYGAAWDRALGQAPLADVMTTWGHELAGFLQSRDAMMGIAWGLENLPERCPNVIEFRNLCRRAPAVDKPQLPAPEADLARVAVELGKLGHIRSAPASPHAMKAWSYRLKARHEAGDKLNPNQIRCYQAVTGIPPTGAQDFGRHAAEGV